MVAPAAPNPSRAGSPAEFVAQMRRLKEWSGLGYKQLEARARRLGDVLPHSTLSTALGREALPRTDLLAAFTRACGCGPAEVEGWLETRARLLAGDPPPAQPTPRPRQPVVEHPPARSTPPAPAPPASTLPAQTPPTSTPVPLPVAVVALPARSVPPSGRYRGRARGVLAVACVFAVGAGAVGAFLGVRRLVDPGDEGRSVAFVAPAASRPATATASPAPPSQPPLPAPAAIARETGSSSAVPRDPTQPADGWYRLRPAHAYSSKLCLDLAEKSNRLILVTATCSRATDQQYRVEATGRSVERIKPRSTRLGRNSCVGVDAAAGDGRAYLRTCGDLHASQVFTVERTRVTSATGPLYRFRPTAHPARCFSIAGRSTKAGAELREEECTGGSNQEFALEKA